MIDNSSAFRMDEDVPLVVPEVNPEDVAWHSGVIANPNCSTIQMVVALKPLYDLSPIKRVVVSTYQAASGAGAPAMAELYDQTRAFLDGTPEDELDSAALSPTASPSTPSRTSTSFWTTAPPKRSGRWSSETKKIMGDPAIEVAATCVRVPVLRCHGEAINVEFADEVTVEAARAALEAAPGVDGDGRHRERRCTRCLVCWPAPTAPSWDVCARIRPCPTASPSGMWPTRSARARP